MKTNQQFKNQALDALSGNWGKAVLLTLILFILIGAFSGPVSYQSVKMQTYMTEHLGSNSSIYGMLSLMQDPEYMAIQQSANGTNGLFILAYILLLAPLMVGYANAFRLLVAKGDNDMVPNAFHISFNHYWNKVWTMLWMYILISLWSLLLIIPGIIKGFSYAMTPYILEDNPELSATEAIHRSRMMMKGHKFDLFWLYLSFIGWAFLCLLTLGIGYIWLYPYIQASEAAFYEEVKADYELNSGLA